MTATDEVRRHAKAFADGDESLAEFAAWFDGTLWDLEAGLEGDGLAALHGIENILAQYVGGHGTEASLRGLVGRFAR